MLRKRALVESVISILKGGLSIEHSRHHSIEDFLSHISGALLAYAFRDKKPSIPIDFNDLFKQIAQIEFAITACIERYNWQMY